MQTEHDDEGGRCQGPHKGIKRELPGEMLFPLLMQPMFSEVTHVLQRVSSPHLAVLSLEPQSSSSQPLSHFSRLTTTREGFCIYSYTTPSFTERFWKAIMPCPCQDRQRWEVKAPSRGIENESQGASLSPRPSRGLPPRLLLPLPWGRPRWSTQ